MKLKAITLQLAILLALFPFMASHGQSREIITLQTGWKFSKENIPNAEQVKFDDAKWQDVSVPHDWAISGPTIVDGD